MEFRDKEYFQAAAERMRQARFLYSEGRSYALAMYCAGLAVECMLRAYRWRKETSFEGRHALLKLLKDSGLLSISDRAMREKGYNELEVMGVSAGLRAAVSDVATLWTNNLRFASEARLKAFIVSINRHLGKKGDPCKASALDLVNAAQKIVEKVKRALNRSFKPVTMDLEDDDGIIGVVVSDKFRRMESIDRQTLIDNALREPLARLSEEEIRHVLAITPMTPEEYVAFGPTGASRNKRNQKQA
jgi:HEPN domain-containing protein/stress-induced morphogen